MIKVRCPFCSSPDFVDAERLALHLVKIHSFNEESAKLLTGLLMSDGIKYLVSKRK